MFELFSAAPRGSLSLCLRVVVSVAGVAVEAEAANEKEWKDLREHERAAASLLGWQSAEARIPKHPRIRVCVYLHTDHLSGPASTSLCFACIGMEWRH